MSDQEVLLETNLLYQHLEGRYTGNGILPFFMMKQYGFRVNEILNYLSWSYDQGLQRFTIQTSKNGTQRFLQLSDIPPTLQYAYFNNNYIFPSHSTSFYEYTIKVYRPYPLYISFKKEILTHLFRHNFVKQGFLQGYNANQLKNYLGVSKIETIYHYRDSNIFK